MIENLMEMRNREGRRGNWKRNKEGIDIIGYLIELRNR